MSHNIENPERQELGAILKKKRLDSQITKYRMTADFGIRHELITAIEEGTANYSVDSLMIYLKALYTSLEFYLNFKD